MSRKRVARIMRQKGLIGRCRRRWTTTTVSDPEVSAADLVKRAFGPDTELLAEHHMVQSLSRPRQCWDNAVGEAWFSTLKVELIHRRSWATRAQARRAIFEFIEVFYNRRRLHSSLNYLTPAEYEACKVDDHQVPRAA